MKKEITIEAKTIDEAIARGAAELGVEASEVSHEVLVEPKHGFLGIGSVDASVKVTYIYSPLEAAKKFAKTLIEDLELDADVVIHDDGNGEALITITGEGSSALIGHHGDTLDAFQYLINLAANKKESDERKYTRISVDIENYREKREQTLRQLARRVAAKVKKYNKSISLEPMSSYERRIIHSEIQSIEGVSTNSVGVEGNRRVVIFVTGGEIPTEESVKAPRTAPAGEKREKKGKRRSKPRTNKNHTAENGEKREKKENKEVREDKKSETPRTYKRSDLPKHEPRKPQKAKDLDSYFEKLKEFSSTFND